MELMFGRVSCSPCERGFGIFVKAPTAPVVSLSYTGVKIFHGGHCHPQVTRSPSRLLPELWNGQYFAKSSCNRLLLAFNDESLQVHSVRHFLWLCNSWCPLPKSAKIDSPSDGVNASDTPGFSGESLHK